MNAKRRLIITVSLAAALSLVGLLAYRTTSIEADTAAEAKLTQQEHQSLPGNQPEAAAPETVRPGDVSVPILVYHSVKPHEPDEDKAHRTFTVSPDNFELQLKYLKDNGYESVGFDALADRLEKGTALPPKPIILTFDDGWRNQYEYAFPLLRKYGFAGTFFVFTNGVNHSSRYLSWAELKEMIGAGMSVESHSVSHPYLTKDESPEKLDKELAGSKKILEDHLGVAVTTFAYPFGLYDEKVVAAVKAAGYRMGRTIHPGSRETLGDLLTLKANIITDNFGSFRNVLERTSAAERAMLK